MLVPPPLVLNPHDKGERVKTRPSKIAQKSVHREFLWASKYIAELRRDVSDNPSNNRVSQRQRWPKRTDKPIDQDQGEERVERGGDGAGGSHRGFIIIGLSVCRHLL